jgi:hypothetical protein
VALGGDCLADIAVLREQPGLSGPVASDPVVSRLVSLLSGDLPRALKAIRAARAAARERAWTLAGAAALGAGGGLVTAGLDATIVIAHPGPDRNAAQAKTGYREVPDEGDCGDGSGRGNGRDDAGRAS